MIMANHFFFLLLSLLAMAASAQVKFVSIDCGSSTANYTDANGISWSSDGSYIHTGENKVVQTPNSGSDQVMNTLRVFSTRKKNCYSIPFTKGEQVLIRASFYYGNYDKKSSPPSFDVLFDGNNWATVETSMTDVISQEAIYIISRDTISVCLAQTQPNQLPFISALEVRSMDSGMYANVDSSANALFLTARFAFGANQTIRYPDDQYDRIWVADQSSDKLISNVKSSATSITTDVSVDYVPPSVVENALTTVNTSTSIVFTGTDINLPTTTFPVYINWYFSEVAVLDPTTELRSFTIDADDVAITNAIAPPYAAAEEMYTGNFSATPNTTFTLVSTTDSTLPPLVNAMEVFVISDPLTNGTNSVDVEQLSLLQTKFAVLAGWGGDPCLPTPYTWDWVACNSDAAPRITALYLSGFGLSGTLPDFSSMAALQTIDLHNNSLTGEIPSFLGKLPNLQELNMADNELSGSVPTSLSNNNNLKLDVSGNQKLCASDSKACQSSISGTSSSSSGKKSSNKLPIILGVTIPGGVVILVIVAFVVFMCNRNNTPALQQ